MEEFLWSDMEEARQTIASMIGRAEKAQARFAEGTSWHTLQNNRIRALRIASALIAKEMGESDEAAHYAKEDLKSAAAPLASVISKSEKAQQKLKQGTWQHTMLDNHLKALWIASPLLAKALGESCNEKEQGKATMVMAIQSIAKMKRGPI